MGSFEVSVGQERLWLDQPDGPTDRVTAVVGLNGEPDAARVRAALVKLTRRHESLRTTFARQPGMRVPVQVVMERLDPAWEELDLGDVPPAERTTRLQEVVEQEQAAPFDFESGPLVRAVLVSLGVGRTVLVLTLSSLSSDVGSLRRAVGDLVAFYGDSDADLIEDPLQYADFAAWQRELGGAEDDAAITAAEFWSAAQARQSPVPPFLLRAGSSVAPGSEVDLGPLRTDVLAGLEAQADTYQVSVDVLVQSAWQALLGRLSGQEEVAVAYVSSARTQADLEGAVGAFSRPVPVTVRAGGAVTIAEMLMEVARGREAAQSCQDYAPAGGSPGLAIGFVGVEAFRASAGGVGFELEQVVASPPPHGLSLICLAGDGSLRLRLRFDPAGVDRGAAQRLAGQLKLVLGAIALDTSLPVGELDLLDETERERTVRRFNDTAATIPSEPVHGLIAGHAARSPMRVAVRDETRSMTYAELEARANQLAHRLRRAGVGPEVAVGLCTDRSVELVVGLLGIMKAGGAFVPLHSEHPPVRLAQQLASVDANVVVTQAALLPRLAEYSGEAVCLDRDHAALDEESTSAPDVGVAHHNLAYVVFTSGSTGTPKGVEVTHGNLVNYATDIARRVGADEESLSFGMVSSISTDLGNTALFGALCSGGTLVLVSPGVAADPGGLARQFAREPVDVLKITPSHLGALLAGEDGRVLPRRMLILGGERASWDLIARVRALGECEIINHYGPTEATVGCATFRVGEGPGQYAPATVPIGRPIANSSCYVLDARHRPQPLGVAGRLFVGGAGVARGYVAAPELTAERFLPDPFASSPARMYDTGDLARWLPDGALEFLGRADEQVKIRGYRVEPAEVEVALRAHPRVAEAVVIARASGAGETELVGYCTSGGSIPHDDLRAHLAGLLPEYMLPVAYVVLPSLPMTPSGKVDRSALPDQVQPTQEEVDFVAPRTALEEALASIWAGVLGLPRVGVTDDFFALGGHSLLATRVVAQIRSDFAVDLPLHSLFVHLSVESLAAELGRLIGESEGDETARLLAELEDLPDEEAERLLAGEARSHARAE